MAFLLTVCLWKVLRIDPFFIFLRSLWPSKRIFCNLVPPKTLLLNNHNGKLQSTRYLTLVTLTQFFQRFSFPKNLEHPAVFKVLCVIIASFAGIQSRRNFMSHEKLNEYNLLHFDYREKSFCWLFMSKSTKSWSTFGLEIVHQIQVLHLGN